MGRGEVGAEAATSGPSCAYLAFEVLNDWANIVHILAMCDALTASGVDTQLLLYPPDGADVPSADDVRERWGLANTPQISWIPHDQNRWIQRARVIAESSRAGRERGFIYSRRPLAALGALAGGSSDVFLEVHHPFSARHDRLAFNIARHSKRLHVVCISRRLAEVVSQQYGLRESTLIVEHTGHNFPIHDDYRVDSAAHRPLRAMYVGTFTPGRGLETIFELAERHPRIDFVAVGGQAPSGGVPNNVTVQGAVPHARVPSLLSQADILLAPYTSPERFYSPLKMFEYMSAGRSIVASGLPSIAEVLVNESNCLLVSPDSIPEWSAALTRLENDVELRVRLAHGAADAAGKHTIAGRARRILERVGTAR